MDNSWLLVLALNFSDGGSQVLMEKVPSKDACGISIKVALAAYAQSATANFKYTAACIDLKNARVDNPQIDIPREEPAPKLPPGRII